MREGAVDCQGGIALNNFILSGPPFENSLSSQKASITCNKQLVLFPLSQWQFGSFITSLSGEIPLTRRSQLDLAINSTVAMNGVSGSKLYIDGKLPLYISSRGFKVGDLYANLNLKP